MSERKLCFITIVGPDKKGIVAQVSQELYESSMNIVDISMKTMEDYFVGSILIDRNDSFISKEKLREQMNEFGKSMNLKVYVDCQEDFKAQ